MYEQETACGAPKRDVVSHRVSTEAEKMAVLAEEVLDFVRGRLDIYTISKPPDGNLKEAQCLETFPSYFGDLRSSIDRTISAISRIRAAIEGSEL